MTTLDTDVSSYNNGDQKILDLPLEKSEFYINFK